MSSLYDFLNAWFGDGRVTYDGPPERSLMRSQHAENLLWRCWREYSLTLPGKAPDFSIDTAYAAAEMLRFSGWHILSPGADQDEIKASVKLPDASDSPTEQISADLLLRALPALHTRARQRQPRSALTLRLEEIIRAWPLSGVLTRLTPGPIVAPSFDDSDCLALLYAERYQKHAMPEWYPAGRALEYVEWMQASALE